VTFLAESGFMASALQQSTGLSVDNTEAVGALSDAAISEGDIRAGRYDSAEVQIWLVNWSDPEMRMMQFRGMLGELQQVDGAFRAELRGLTELLNQPQGRVYQKDCAAVLGDRACKLDTTAAQFTAQVPVVEQAEGRTFRFAPTPEHDTGWFERGRLIVQSGAAAGLQGLIKNDVSRGAYREVELWEAIAETVQPGDVIRLVAGCDKRLETCRVKFGNVANYQGFPQIPGDDWLVSYPTRSGRNDGGSLGG
jgi:uncharacterized phage protein (TIGR02218 family)